MKNFGKSWIRKNLTHQLLTFDAIISLKKAWNWQEIDKFLTALHNTCGMAAVSLKKDRKEGHVVCRYILKTKTIKKKIYQSSLGWKFICLNEENTFLLLQLNVSRDNEK